MPYIQYEARGRVAITGLPATAGELNFLVTRIITRYLAEQEVVGYQQMNDVMGALESAKQEFYRRVVAPYEDKKIVENGDVY